MMFYGRNDELAVLQEAFQWASLGSTELVLISGPPGIGKSAFVLQAFKPAVSASCKFAWGKFDPYSTSNPYAPIVTCFQYLIRQLLTEPEAELNRWKDRIREAVGDNGSVIAEIIPEAKLLIGDLPPSEKLPASKSHHRFEWVFHRFVRVFASAKHPLVLFFDDIQWADRATFALLHSLLIDPDLQHLMIVGAYRDQDWNNNELLFHEFLQGEHNGYSLRQLHLEPLELSHVQSIVSDALSCDYAKCFPLAHALYVKTIGNPFYLKQLLHEAREDRLLRYIDDTGEWEWDLGKLSVFPSIDGQIEYLIGRINRLPTPAQRLLITAACLGGKFSCRLLSAVSALSESELAGPLFAAVQAGLLAAEEERDGCRAYSFTHDRIHQAAYSLLHDRERMEIHLAAGRFLLEMYHAGAREQVLFELANHMNEAFPLMSPDEKEQCFLLNVEAGGKAMQSSAYAEALEYFHRAIECLPDRYWDDRNDLAFQLFLRCAECEYLCTRYEQAEHRLDGLLLRAQSWLQRAQVAKLKIDQYSNTGKYAQAIALGCEMLSEAGVRIAIKPSPSVVKKEMLHAKRLLDERMDELSGLPETDDPKIALMMELMISLVGPTFFSNREVFALLSSRFIRLVYEHGTTPIAPAIYASYGMVLCTILTDLPAGYRLGKIAMDAADRSGIPSVRSKVYAMFHCVISPWMGYRRQDEQQVMDAIHYGLQSGDYVFASYATGGLINLSYAVHSMKRMQQVMGQCLQYVEITKEELIYKNVMIYLHFAEMMQSPEVEDFSMTVGRASEEEFLRDVMQDESRAVTLYQFYTYKTQICYLFGQYEEAIQYAELARPYEALSVQSPHMPILHFYEAMALAASLRQTAGRRPAWRQMLKRRQRQFQRWSEMSAHFGHKAMLLNAEILRSGGPEQDIIDLYDQAIDRARESSDPQYRALACERAARHHLEKGRLRIARGYMQEACEAYEQWGVELKCSRLRKEFPDWFPQEKQDQPAVSFRHRALPHHPDRMPDAAHVLQDMKDLLAFSPDMNLQDVQKRLTALIMKAAEMNYGCLVSQRNDGLWIEQIFKPGQAISATPEWVEQSDALPRSLVQYTFRCGQPVQLGRGAEDELFANDPYIVAHQCQTISCLPVYAQKQIAGVLYLELPPDKHPLSGELADTLGMLAAQSLFMIKLSETFGDGAAASGKDIPVSIEDRMIDPLTDRELEVLNFMSMGLTNKEIAVRLGITAGTVKVHTHNVFSKLNVNRRMKAVAMAERMNLLHKIGEDV